jgi:hypothetical protein
MDFVVLEGDLRVMEGCVLEEVFRFGEGVQISLVPRAESTKCEDIALMVRGGRDEVSVGEGCAGGEADRGRGGLSMVVKLERSS